MHSSISWAYPQAKSKVVLDSVSEYYETERWVTRASSPFISVPPSSLHPAWHWSLPDSVNTFLWPTPNRISFCHAEMRNVSGKVIWGCVMQRLITGYGGIQIYNAQQTLSIQLWRLNKLPTFTRPSRPMPSTRTPLPITEWKAANRGPAARACPPCVWYKIQRISMCTVSIRPNGSVSRILNRHSL